MKQVENKTLHLIELFLPIYPLLVQYQFGIINMGMVGLLIVAGMTVINSNCLFYKKKQYRPYLVFLIYVVFRDTIRILVGNDAIQTQINRMIEYVLVYIFVFLSCNGDFDEDRLYTVWKRVGFIYMLGILYHVCCIYLLNKNISPITIIPGYIIRPQETIAQLRPCSFFAEPAAFVSAILPLEFLALKKNDIKIAIFVLISILLSTSTIGIVLSAILWVGMFLSSNYNQKSKIMILLCALIILGIFTSSSLFLGALDKVIEVVKGGSTVGSRILVGVKVVKSQSIFSLVFGTNYNEVTNYITDNINKFSQDSLIMAYYNQNRVFLNTFCRLFFMYGGIGVFLFYFPLVKYVCKSQYNAKLYLLMTIIGTFAQTMLLNPAYFMMITLLLFYAGEDEIEQGHMNICIKET